MTNLVTRVLFIKLFLQAFSFKFCTISITKCKRSLAVHVLQTALLTCTIAKDIYEFLAGDSVK